jgi:hypothetical protein
VSVPLVPATALPIMHAAITQAALADAVEGREPHAVGPTPRGIDTRAAEASEPAAPPTATVTLDAPAAIARPAGIPETRSDRRQPPAAQHELEVGGVRISTVDSHDAPTAPAAEGASAPTAAGIATAIDGALTNVSRLSASPRSGEAALGVASTTTGGLRDRTRAAATEASDHRAIARGMNAQVDLGEAGRVTVRTENPASRIDVRLDAEVSATARSIAANAQDLASELRTDTREARVIVNGPSTHTTVTSNGASAGDSNGHSASSRRDADPQNPRDGRAPQETGVDRGADASPSPRAARRARFVL